MLDTLTALLHTYGMLIAAGLMVVCALAASALAYEELSRRSQVDRRLATQSGTAAPSSATGFAAAGSSLQWLEQIGRRLSQVDEKEVVGLKLRLHQAGFAQRDAVFWLYGARALMIVILPIIVLALATILGAGLTPFGNLLIAGAGAGVGLILPSFALDFRIKQLRNEYRRGFPDFLDLLVVCLESGMSFEAGLDRINIEIGQAYPHLRDNVTQLLREMRAGKDRAAALFALADRLALEEAQSFANMIVQAEQLGSGIAQTLRVCADDMRDRRLLRAEEYAQALPVMLVVPLGAFIFPAILIVTLLPAGIGIYDAFLAPGR